jgi:hypothetical protein
LTNLKRSGSSSLLICFKVTGSKRLSPAFEINCLSVAQLYDVPVLTLLPHLSTLKYRSLFQFQLLFFNKSFSGFNGNWSL